MKMMFQMEYILFVMLPGMLLAMWAQAKVKRAYARASQIPARSGLSGAEAAREILQSAGFSDVPIQQTQGFLSDHYDPRHRVLRLSPDVYHGRSLASLGIAAHEAGHALQHAQNYAPLGIRNALVPMASLGSNISYTVLVLGFFLSHLPIGRMMILAGIALFSLTVLFQVINLPCEFNASSRARQQLLGLGLVTQQEDAQVQSVLSAAALTYVAAVISSVLTLLYFLWRSGLIGGRR